MDATSSYGLTRQEAAARLRKFGPNTLPNPDRRRLARIVLDVVRQPMFALLLGGAGVYFLLGNLEDAGVLALFATLSVSISIVQESRSERVMESLRDLASPRALVIRDGSRERIPGRDLVPGDLIILVEGDRVPADCVLLGGEELLADESLLTGESVPVLKKPGSPETPWRAPGEGVSPFAFAGTLIVRGTGTAQVAATGLLSEMGKIGQALRDIVLEQPKLQRQLRGTMRIFALLGVTVTVLVVLLSGLLRGSWLEAALSGITVGMSVLPEEIPLVLAVFMAMGAWRISRAGVLTRRAAAIETLGSATILCTDKTGTLTENRMRLELIAAKDASWISGARLTAADEAILQAAWAACAPVPTDPMDRATHDAALAGGLVAPRMLVHSYGLRPDLLATTNIRSGANGTTANAYAKGAPEAIVELCDLSADDRAQILRQMDHLAAEGMRLLAVAEAEISPSGDAYPRSPRGMPFRYLGLIGFADPLRPTVPAAIKQCEEAGIRVIMITGDYPATARAIARQAGIESSAVLSGDDLEAMSSRELAAAVRNTSVFARIRPHQKLKLVEAFKADGETVAMTGDGVNDAPAMKAAHIGIAMGSRGTDVAREAASLVLLQDDFSSIVTTIRLGRRIYDNLRKALEYIIAVHIPIAGLAILPLLLGLPLMLLPIHIAMLEMVIDPACSIVFESEPEEYNVMRRPPRRSGDSLLSSGAARWSILQGLATLGIVASVLLMGSTFPLDQEELRALVFTLLVLMNIALILINRSFGSSLRVALLRPNRALWILAATVSAVLAGALFWRPANALFRFAPLHMLELAGCVAVAAASIGLLEMAKRIPGLGTSWCGRPKPTSSEPRPIFPT